ncbi:hypothetical protein P9112_009724 [Eukaryota sp. TZLM1-RC]
MTSSLAKLDDAVGDPLTCYPSISLQKYIDKSRELLNTALDHYSASDHESAYILFKRYILFVTKTVVKHPSARSNPTALSNLRQFAQKAAQFLTECREIILQNEQTIPQPDPSTTLDAPEPSTNDTSAPDTSPHDDVTNDVTDYPAYDTPLHGEDEPSAPPSAPPSDLSSSAMYQNPDQPASPPDLQTSLFGDQFNIPPSNKGGFASLYGSLLSLNSPTAFQRKESLSVVQWPSLLSDQFISLVSEDLSHNRESCALLCGSLNQSTYQISHMILPKQEGDADSCHITDETSIIPVIENHDLIILGWIHTHPTQTAFLSAVDLHTHLGLQMSLAESIAIVVSMKDGRPNVEVFHLSNEGLSEVSSCSKSGHHQHSKGSFLKANHSEMIDGKVDVIDLR